MSNSNEPETKNIDKQSEEIIDNLRDAYASIKQLENSISHRKIVLNIEKKLHEENKKKNNYIK